MLPNFCFLYSFQNFWRNFHYCLTSTLNFFYLWNMNFYKKFFNMIILKLSKKTIKNNYLIWRTMMVIFITFYFKIAFNMNSENKNLWRKPSIKFKSGKFVSSNTTWISKWISWWRILSSFYYTYCKIRIRKNKTLKIIGIWWVYFLKTVTSNK